MPNLLHLVVDLATDADSRAAYLDDPDALLDGFVDLTGEDVEAVVGVARLQVEPGIAARLERVEFARAGGDTTPRDAAVASIRAVCEAVDAPDPEPEPEPTPDLPAVLPDDASSSEDAAAAPTSDDRIAIALSSSVDDTDATAIEQDDFATADTVLEPGRGTSLEAGLDAGPTPAGAPDAGHIGDHVGTDAPWGIEGLGPLPEVDDDVGGPPGGGEAATETDATSGAGRPRFTLPVAGTGFTDGLPYSDGGAVGDASENAPLDERLDGAGETGSETPAWSGTETGTGTESAAGDTFAPDAPPGGDAPASGPDSDLPFADASDDRGDTDTDTNADADAGNGNAIDVEAEDATPGDGNGDGDGGDSVPSGTGFFNVFPSPGSAVTVPPTGGDNGSDLSETGLGETGPGETVVSGAGEGGVTAAADEVLPEHAGSDGASSWSTPIGSRGIGGEGDAKPDDEFGVLELVVLVDGLPAEEIDPGAPATIVAVHRDPTLAYEIEVAGPDGGRLFLGVVPPDALARP